MQSAFNLSRQRAEAVRKSIIEFASKNNMRIDPSQIQPSGVGIKEPLIAKPRNVGEANQNMRVEFRLVRVTAEPTKQGDFDF
jgi:outer membrane protein OmpA-like peptidoglycan-associated protein